MVRMLGVLGLLLLPPPPNCYHYEAKFNCTELPGTLDLVPAFLLRSEALNRRPHLKQSGPLQFHFIKEISKLMGGWGTLYILDVICKCFSRP